MFRRIAIVDSGAAAARCQTVSTMGTPTATPQMLLVGEEAHPDGPVPAPGRPPTPYAPGVSTSRSSAPGWSGQVQMPHGWDGALRPASIDRRSLRDRRRGLRRPRRRRAGSEPRSLHAAAPHDRRRSEDGRRIRPCHANQHRGAAARGRSGRGLDRRGGSANDAWRATHDLHNGSDHLSAGIRDRSVDTADTGTGTAPRPGACRPAAIPSSGNPDGIVRGGCRTRARCPRRAAPRTTRWSGA